MSDFSSTKTVLLTPTNAGLEPTIIRAKKEYPDSIIGRVLDDRYRIDELIGRGGMGAVYAGRHILMERQVAIKALLPQQGVTDELEIESFQREAVNTCKVDHPNAIIVHDFLFIDSTPYMIMEYVQGETLMDVYLRERPFRLARIYALLGQVCSALSKTHSVGLIHRDLKLDNIMLVSTGEAEEQVKVLDFGIAELAEAALGGRTTANLGNKMIVGTPMYMSPEQITGQVVDARCDVYALGVILYILLAGEPPFRGSSEELWLKHLKEQPPSLPGNCGDESISPELSTVVMRTLEKDPDRRFESVLEFMGALKDAVLGKTEPSQETGQMTASGATQRIYSMNELLDTLEEARGYFSRGDYLTTFNILDVVVKNGVSDPKIIHLAVLSLARSGATELASNYFEKYREHLPETEDFLAIEARLLRDRFRQSQNVDERKVLGNQARDAYLAIYHKTSGFYTAINAATLSFLIGDTTTANELARQALQLCESENNVEDYWACATRAEASVLLGRYDDAASHLKQAVNLAGEDIASLNTTRRQLKWICATGDIDLDRIQVPEMPRVIHYTGRMINGLGSNPGIDPDDVGMLERAVADMMQQENVGYAYGSLACGADIMVAEAALARGCELTVVLPFEQNEFLKTSVSPAGLEWESRFYRVLDAARRVKTIPGELCDDHELRFRHAASQAMGMARLRAAQFDSEAIQCALYTEQTGKKLAGTAADLQLWQALGLRYRVIEVPTPRHGVDHCAEGRGSPATVDHEFNTVIVATATNKEARDARKHPIATDRWLQRVAGITQRYEDEIMSTSVWANRVFIVTDSVEIAPSIADELLQIFAHADVAGDLPGFGVHVLIHSGITYCREGLVGGQKVYFGTAVNVAADLDIGSLSNSIYATEDFAAHYALAEPRMFRCEIAGECSTWNNEQRHRMYYFRKL